MLLGMRSPKVGPTPVGAWRASTSTLAQLAALATHSRTSLATMFDSTGKLTYAPNNLLLQSNTFSNAAWTKTNASITSANSIADPFGGTTASVLNLTGGTAGYAYQGVGVSGTNHVVTFWVRSNTGGSQTFALFGNNLGAISSNLTATTTWQQFSFSFASTVAGGAVGIRTDSSNNAAALQIYGATVSAVTYETLASQRPADQVITTSSAYYGPRIDYDPNTLAVKGLLIEENRTWVALWNRDFTNAAWTKTSVTAALDQVGIDGVANSASSLTASANNGTVLQAITLASSQRATSAYVKRLVGSGAVSMTTDGGTTWTDITSQLGAGAYARATIPAQTVTNPSVGFKFATSGDKIAVDFFGNENGAFQTSPLAVASASVTRAADSVTAAASTLGVASGQGTIIAEADWVSPPSVDAYFFDATNGERVLIYKTTGNAIAAGVQHSSSFGMLATGGSTAITGNTVRAGIAWSAASASSALNGAIAVTGAGKAATPTTIYLGADYTTGGYLNGHIRSFAAYNQRLPDATLQAKSVVGASY